jgi:hypothetical protein
VLYVSGAPSSVFTKELKEHYELVGKDLPGIMLKKETLMRKKLKLFLK